MRIGELAKCTETSTSRLRFYEKKGLLPKAVRQNNGYRDYPAFTVELVKLIKVAQFLGFTLSEIQQFLPDVQESATASSVVTRRLEDKMEAIDQQVKELLKLRGRIAMMTDHIEKQKNSGECSTISELYQWATVEK